MEANTRPPWGYYRSREDSTKLVADRKALETLSACMDHLDNDSLSLRKAVEWMAEEGYTISTMGLKKVWDRYRPDSSIKLQRLRKHKKEEKARRRARSKVENQERDKLKRRNRKIANERLKVLNAQKRIERLSEERNSQLETVEALTEASTKSVVESLEALKPFIEENNLTDRPILFRPNPGPQEDFLAAPELEVLFGGAAGGGKVLADDGIILTPFGWKRGEDLKIGDTICHPNGGVQKIILLHPRKTYEKWTVVFSDNTSTDVAEEHLWQAWRGRHGVKKNNKRVFGHDSAEVITTKTLKKWLDRGYTPQIPVTKPTIVNSTSNEKNKIDPYILGVFLGDGCITQENISIACREEDKNHYKQYFSTKEDEISWFTKGTIRPIGAYRKYLVEKLKQYSLLGTNSETKFIPKQYIWSSVEDRYAILQGLMDTDGWSARGKNSIYFDTVSPHLSKDVSEIVRSLGGIVTITKSKGSYKKDGVNIPCKDVYHLYIRLPNPDLAFRMKRKQLGTFGKNLIQKSVKDVVVGGTLTGRCITVSNPDGLYITNDYIVTHNSYALIADPLRYIENKNFVGLILRRTNDELRELIWKTKELYPQIEPGAKFSEKASEWRFPSGARLWMSYLDRDDDVLRYQGQAYTWIGFDELTHWPTPYPWEYLRSRLRTHKGSGLETSLGLRATTNPGGPGHVWVKKMFIDPAPPNTSFWARDLETGETLKDPETEAPLFKRRFIPSTLRDNPFLWEDGNYRRNLLGMPESRRRQLLDGDWTIADGAAFPEFNTRDHVVEPFTIDPSWIRFRSMDYGYSSYSCVLWFAINPSTEQLVVYRELYVHKMTGETIADTVLRIEREAGERPRYGMLDSSVWHKRGEGPSIAEVMISRGCKWRPSDRSQGSRVAGKNRLHELLKVDEFSGEPGIVFFNTCRQVISDLQVIPVDPKGGDDIDDRFKSDHSYDALRYGIMSRPKTNIWGDSYGLRTSPKVAMDSVFGY